MSLSNARARAFGCVVAAAAAGFVALAGSAGRPGPPDEAATDPGRPSFVDRVTVSRVRWPVIVRPEKGRAPARCDQLGPGDFEVTEEGRAVSVLDVEQGPQPTVFALLIDASRSMAPRLEDIKEEAALLAADLARDHEVLVASFTEALTVRETWTRDSAAARAAVRAVEQGERTALADALAGMLDVLEERRERRVLVLFGDGEDSASRRHGVQEIIDRVARTRALRIFPVVVAPHEDLRFTGRLRLLAHATGGHFDIVREPEDLREVFGAMRERLAREVVLTWRPTQPPADQRDAESERPARVRVKARLRDGLPCRAEEAVAERILPPTPPAGVTLD